MNITQNSLTKKKAQEVTTNMESLMNEINELVEENIALKESQGVSAQNTFDTRTRINNNLF